MLYRELLLNIKCSMQDAICAVKPLQQLTACITSCI